MAEKTVWTRITSETAAHLQLRRGILTTLAASLLVNACFAVHLVTAGDASRTVVLAPGADVAYIAQNDKVSANLLERFTVTALTMITNMTPATAQYQTQRFMESVAPESWAGINQLLSQGVAELVKTKAAVAFFPEAVRVDADSGDVCMSGERRVLIGKTVTSSEMKTLCAGTVVRGGRLWITQLTEGGF